MRFGRIATMLCIALSLCVASISAQIDPAVTDVVTYSRSDTTIRVVISTGGHEHLVSTAVVEWLVPDDAHPGERRILARADVPILASGLYAAAEPFFDVDDKGLACIMTITNSHIGSCPPDQRIRIRIGDPGKVTCEYLNDLALKAVNTITSPRAPLKNARDHMTCSGDYVIEYVKEDLGGSESPWTVVRDTTRDGRTLLEAVGILEEVYNSPEADGSIELVIDAYECCAGTKSFYEHYRIEPSADTAKLIHRVLLMYELYRPRSFHSVAEQITVTDTMKLRLCIDRMMDVNTMLEDDELRAWTHGVSLIPNSTAWIVATQEHWGRERETWALVIGYPELTPDVQRMFISDNSDAPGMIAGWVKIGERK